MGHKEVELAEHYVFGEEGELDKIRTEVNIKKVISGLNNNLKRATKVPHVKSNR